MSLFGDKLFTPRLCLRRMGKPDLPQLVEWSRSTEAYGKYLSPENLKTDQLGQQLQAGVFWNDREKVFLILRREDEKMLGTIHYWQPVGREKTAAMALKIALPEERGKGYGTEAQKYLVSYLFDRCGMEQVEMHTDIDNMIEQRCLRKLGFELVDSLSYTDQQVQRIGHLYRLTRTGYAAQPIYQYHEL